MARPAKSVKTQSRHNTKSEEKQRQEVEEKIRGKADNLRPPTYLSNNQKKIFRKIKKELDESGILSNLDVYILTQFSIAVDRLQDIECKINDDFSLIFNKDFMASKDKYTKDLYRCCNELCLSPQARAKIGSLNLTASKNKEDPLLNALKEANEYDG